MSNHAHVMRPLEERHVSVPIDLMVWSTKMDLIALSYSNGEVVLHRLNWLRVWVLSPPMEEVTVKGIAWRPDGKVIAIGYSNKELILVDVEHKDTICKTSLDGDITCVAWSDEREESKCGRPANTSEPYHVFIPNLPSLTRTSGEEHVNDAKGIEDQKELNFLYVGLSTGKLVISVFGLYPKATIDIRALLDLPDCLILDASTSKNHDVLLVTVLSGSTVWVITLDTPLLYDHDRNLMTLAYKYGHITSCLDYMDLTLQNIIEGWENIMMEMDIKLKAYAAKVPAGRVSCDFLELLMFGTATQQMSEFLLDDLTEKGLKKLNHSIEISYINIQSLVLKHLQAMGQSLSFQLDELCGLSRCPDFHQILGLPEADTMAAFAATGSFMIKVAEVQHVIVESLKKYKAFFRWLYATILRLCEERVSPEHSNMSQDDLQRIVDFLNELEGEKGFNLEQLGQYLIDAPLTSPTPPSESWESLLDRYPTIASLPQIVPHNKTMSLVQEAKHLRRKVSAVFESTEKTMTSHFKLKFSTHIKFTEGIGVTALPKVTHSYVADHQKFMIAILDPLHAEGYHFMEIGTAEDNRYMTFVQTEKRVVDLQFYLPDVLSLLLDMSPEQDTGFAQLMYPLVGEPCSFRVIQGIVASKLAVSGIRKVAMVLSESRRKVKIFEMDVEEEDDEEGMDTSNSTVRDLSELLGRG